MQYLANPEERAILAENVKTLLGGFSQSLLKEGAKKTGLSARAIAYMISAEDCNPRLSSLTAFARGYKVSIAQLLTKNLGAGVASPTHVPVSRLAAQESKSPAYLNTTIEMSTDDLGINGSALFQGMTIPTATQPHSSDPIDSLPHLLDDSQKNFAQVMRLPTWEIELLNAARGMSDDGRRELIGMAKLLASQKPRESASLQKAS